MQQFLIVAAAHLLALLSPGPDFFLMARTSLAAGRRVATGTAVGIALANGVFIVTAFTGAAALRQDSAIFAALQIAGGVYLIHLGMMFLRHAASQSLQAPESSPTAPARSGLTWTRAAGAGFLSGILNPKNALFYASLAAMLSGPHASVGGKTVYGVWMFSVVLGWNALVAGLIGHPVVLRRFALALPWLERSCGALLLALGVGVVMARVLG